VTRFWDKTSGYFEAKSQSKMVDSSAVEVIFRGVGAMDTILVHPPRSGYNSCG